MSLAADRPVGDRRAELVVNSHRIPLNESIDLSSLKSELLTAATGTGAFVQIESRHGTTYEVLVTPATQVVIVHLPAKFESGPPDSSWSTVIDLDI
ncbi:MAG: hypothetical protein Q7J04_00440 [Microcella sp.]|nr:hypothetical protein [Microcella sp.]